MPRAHVRRSSLVALAAALLSIASPALAQSPRSHHGLYVRVAVGGSYFSDAVESDPVPLFGTATGTLTGAVVSTELAVGGSISPGFVVGGALLVNHIPSPKTTDGQYRTSTATFSSPEIDFDPTTLTVIGPFADYYFGATSGLHVGASVGYGILSLGQGTGGPIPFPDQRGSGVAAVLGAGYEWWVSESWGVGVLGQLMIGFGSGKDTRDNSWRHRIIVPGLMLSATMN
jgi:hypothetical protein